ncbi:MAG: hypothetical protein ABJB97_04555 [Acidobacteriota bacterium]
MADRFRLGQPRIHDAGTQECSFNPYVSRYPAISFPILIIWPLITYLFAKRYLQATTDKAAEGLRLGACFAAVNLILDLLVLVLLFGNGVRYFLSLTVWLAYLQLLLVPWLTGRSTQNPPAA